MMVKLGRRPPLAVGTVIDGRFELLELLGAGCFGAVYRAKQLVFGHRLREVALKLFAAEQINRDNVREIFNDAVTLIAMQELSPSLEVRRHLIEVYDIGFVDEPSPQAFMSMKLIPGRKTLETEIRRFGKDGMPLATAMWFLRQLLVPLAWMHTLDVPVVHGDLKPDNVLLTPSGDVVLTDFGLAAHLPLRSLGGAISYQAPETLLQHGADSRADIYGVGLIWYQMLTGRHLFDGIDVEATGARLDQEALVQAHALARKWPIRAAALNDDATATGRIPLASESHAELRQHPQLEAILNRCLSYRQSDRYANAQLLLRDLDQYAATNVVVGLDKLLTFHAREPAAVVPAAPLVKTSAQVVQDVHALLDRGDARAALSLLEKASQEPPSEAMKLAEAKVRLKLSDAKRALDLCAEAVRMAPGKPDVLEAAADVMLEAGKASMAASYRDQARELRNRRQGARRG